MNGMGLKYNLLTAYSHDPLAWGRGPDNKGIFRVKRLLRTIEIEISGQYERSHVATWR